MDTSVETSAIADEIGAVKHALRELLIAKLSLEAQRPASSSFGLADRKFRRVRRAIERQTLNLASDLVSLGVSNLEIAEVIREAERASVLAAQRERVAV